MESQCTGCSVSNLFAVQDHATFRGEGKLERFMIVLCQCDMTLQIDHKVLLIFPDLMVAVGW